MHILVSTCYAAFYVTVSSRAATLWPETPLDLKLQAILKERPVWSFALLAKQMGLVSKVKHTLLEPIAVPSAHESLPRPLFACSSTLKKAHELESDSTAAMLWFSGRAGGRGASGMLLLHTR